MVLSLGCWVWRKSGQNGQIFRNKILPLLACRAEAGEGGPNEEQGWGEESKIPTLVASAIRPPATFSHLMRRRNLFYGTFSQGSPESFGATAGLISLAPLGHQRESAVISGSRLQKIIPLLFADGHFEFLHHGQHVFPNLPLPLLLTSVLSFLLSLPPKVDGCSWLD
jgi:hypothetical protein